MDDNKKNPASTGSPPAGGTPPDGDAGDNFAQFRSQIKQSIDDMASRRKADQLHQRIDVARVGMSAYEQKNFADAVKYFHQYLLLLEDAKGVKEGGLTPNLFSSTEDKPEMLLISGVFWDLAIIFDRTDSSRAQKLFKKYLQQFVLFTKGMEYETVCAENLRKYLATNKAKHRSDFKSAYSQLGGERCFVATVLMDELEPHTVRHLRHWRDTVLLSTRTGRFFVRTYYKIGPFFARGVAHAPRGIRQALAAFIRFLEKRTLSE